MLKLRTINRVIVGLRNKNFFVFVFLLWLFYTAFHLLFEFSHKFLLDGKDIVFVTSTPNVQLFEYDMSINILTMVFLGPLIETFLFQTMPYLFLNHVGWFRQNMFAIVIIGAFSFGLLHFFTLSYVLFNVFAGGFLMFTYVIRQRRLPYLSTFALHAINNLTAIILIRYFEF